MQKRNNPFAKRTNPLEQLDQEIIEKTVDPVVEVTESIPEEQPEEYIPPVTPKVTVRQPQTIPSNRYRSYASEQPANDREKYTATMDKNLRKDIKFACVSRGIMFSQFIEEACAEKLKRERGR